MQRHIIIFVMLCATFAVACGSDALQQTSAHLILDDADDRTRDVSYFCDAQATVCPVLICQDEGRGATNSRCVSTPTAVTWVTVNADSTPEVDLSEYDEFVVWVHSPNIVQWGPAAVLRVEVTGTEGFKGNTRTNLAEHNMSNGQWVRVSVSLEAIRDRDSVYLRSYTLDFSQIDQPAELHFDDVGVYRTECEGVPTIEAAHMFYNDSSWDVVDDADAIAIDKQPLAPGQTATLAHVSGYSHGINGVMVDVHGLRTRTLTAADFAFHVRTNDDPETWSAAPDPTSIDVSWGQGVNGSDRVKLIWANGAIVDTWLHVRVLADGAVDLLHDYDFYFGNLVGNTNADWEDVFVIDVADLGVLGANYGDVERIDMAGDINKDKVVNQTDVDFLGEWWGGSLSVLHAPGTVPDDHCRTSGP